MVMVECVYLWFFLDTCSKGLMCIFVLFKMVLNGLICIFFCFD